MKNENTPNLNELLNTADSMVGTGMNALGCFTIVFFLMWPFIGITYLIGTYFFGLPR